MRILIVDDDSIVRKTLADMARALHFEPIEAEDGEQALEKIRTYKPISAMITDFQMPGMNGIQLIKTVKSIHPGMFIVLSSGDESAKGEADLICPKPQGLQLFRELQMELQQ